LRSVYGRVECDDCGHATVGKTVHDVVPAGRDNCPRCGGTDFSVVERT
jgi:Zn finger protein HypA/HybF involved in hydrogenase expression